jgi:hypothetical protein
VLYQPKGVNVLAQPKQPLKRFIYLLSRVDHRAKATV